MDCRKEELAEVLHSNCALQHQQRLQQANLDALQAEIQSIKNTQLAYRNTVSSDFAMDTQEISMRSLLQQSKADAALIHEYSNRASGHLLALLRSRLELQPDDLQELQTACQHPAHSCYLAHSPQQITELLQRGQAAHAWSYMATRKAMNAGHSAQLANEQLLQGISRTHQGASQVELQAKACGASAVVTSLQTYFGAIEAELQQQSHARKKLTSMRMLITNTERLLQGMHSSVGNACSTHSGLLRGLREAASALQQDMQCSSAPLAMSHAGAAADASAAISTAISSSLHYQAESDLGRKHLSPISRRVQDRTVGTCISQTDPSRLYLQQMLLGLPGSLNDVDRLCLPIDNSYTQQVTEDAADYATSQAAITLAHHGLAHLGKSVRDAILESRSSSNRMMMDVRP